MSKEMNIEEAIEYTKNFIKYFNKNKDNGNKANLIVLGEEIQAIETVLADRERLEKECDSKEKAYNDCYCKYKHYKQFESISKDKIREKIEKLQNELKYIGCGEDCSKCFDKEGKPLYRGSSFTFCYAYHQIKILQELLKGSEKIYGSKF